MVTPDDRKFKLHLLVSTALRIRRGEVRKAEPLFRARASEAVRLCSLPGQSPLAGRILADWKGHLAEFWKVTPHVPAAKSIEEKKVEEGKTFITEAITASPKA